MKRVCVLLRSLAPGGAEKQALLLVQALRPEHDARLVVVSREPRTARHEEFIRRHGIPVVFLPDGWLARALALRRLLAREAFDALFTFLPSDTVLGAVVGRLARVPRVYGGLRNARLLPRKERALRLVHRHLVDATISNSHAAARHFAGRGFDGRKLLVVPNAIVLRPAPPPRAARDEVTVVTVGRFVPEKDPLGSLALVRAVADACGAAPRVRYVLAGSGPMEAAIRARVRELGLEDVVALVVDPPEVEPLLARADVYLSLSRFEGVSNAILEAMEAALPVVATDVGDNARLVAHGTSGYLAPVGDERALGDHLVSLARSPELRAELGRAGRRIAERDYSLEAFRAAYARLLAGDATPASG